VRSRRKLFFFIAVLLISGMAVTACGTKSSDEPGVQPPITDLTQLMTKNVSGLAPAKQYYWKVVADDGKGALTESETSSFTTLLFFVNCFGGGPRSARIAAVFVKGTDIHEPLSHHAGR
jgi:hypothetical protein